MKFHLIHDTSLPDDGRRHRMKHVELINNKYINQNSCILLVIIYNYTNDAQTHERQYRTIWRFFVKVSTKCMPVGPSWWSYLSVLGKNYTTIRPDNFTALRWVVILLSSAMRFLVEPTALSDSTVSLLLGDACAKAYLWAYSGTVNQSWPDV